MGQIRFSTLLLILCGLFLANCSKKEEPIKKSKFEQLYEGLLELGHRCRKCHIDTEEAYTDKKILLNFRTADTAYETLTKLKSVNFASDKCKGIPYVTGGKIEESFLAAVTIVKYNKQGFYGKADCIPVKDHTIGNRKLSDNEVALIEAWITDGANR